MRVLVDTSVWLAHFRQANADLMELLDLEDALMHPMVLGEVACGTPPSRSQTLSDLADLPSVQLAGTREVLAFVERERLFGLGCGLVDITLLASTLMTPDVELWTFDKRLQTLAERFGVLRRAKLH